ncbi:MAG: hypothetical protein ACJ8FU_15590 [Xanthobacteraceae bacterium]
MAPLAMYAMCDLSGADSTCAIIAAFGGLGGIAKIDRVIQVLGMIAAKGPSILPPRPPTVG